MTIPVDPTLLATIAQQGGLATTGTGGAAAAGTGGALAADPFAFFGAQEVMNSYAQNPNQSLSVESMGLLSDAAQNAPMMSANPTSTDMLTGATTVPMSAGNAGDILAKATSSGPVAPQTPPKMAANTKLQDLSNAFKSMTAQPSDFAPVQQAGRSGFSAEIPTSNVDPYGSAAANKGLLELMRNAYSLGV